jgi:uncharacterized protein YjcR
MLGQGLGTAEIARRLGVSAKTISRWKQLPGFESAVALTVDPTIRSTLEAAMLANKKSGEPDWPTRVSAARALAALGPEAGTPSHQPTVVTIYRSAA